MTFTRIFAKALDDVRPLSENIWSYIIVVPPKFGFGDLSINDP